MKKNWYSERKKIHLEIGTFRLIIISCFLFVLLASILLLIDYLNPVKWNSIVKTSKNIPGFEKTSESDKQNIVKLVYLTRFWGSVGTMIILQISAYIYLKKAKHGYLFIGIWLALIVGLILLHTILLTHTDWYIYLKLIPLCLLLFVFLYELKETIMYRKALNKKYYNKIKKGEL